MRRNDEARMRFPVMRVTTLNAIILTDKGMADKNALLNRRT
jgi:hypothetical protein